MMRTHVIDQIRNIAREANDERTSAVIEGNSDLARWLQDAHDQLVLVAHDLAEDETVTWDEVFDDAEDETTEVSPSERRATIVRQLMDERGLSVEDVAEEAGLGERTVRNIVNANTTRPHTNTLRTLEGFFDLAEGGLDD